MKISISEGISVYIEKKMKKRNSVTLFLIHGFAGSSEDWKECLEFLNVKYNTISVDMPGFGKSDKPEIVQFYQPGYLNLIIDEIIHRLKLENVVLVGYSMGGRIALNYCMYNQSKIKILIVESSSPGIQNLYEREERKRKDNELINLIQSQGLRGFVEYWSGIELFQSQKNLPLNKQLTQNIRRYQNSPIGLINSLKGFGTGEMEPLWKNLNELEMPTLLITGEYDLKYNMINQDMKKMIPVSQHTIVPEAGHNIHLEKPEEFVILVDNFITDYLKY